MFVLHHDVIGDQYSARWVFVLHHDVISNQYAARWVGVLHHDVISWWSVYSEMGVCTSS